MMNKDALLATIIGLVLGLTIAGVFIFGPTALKLMPKMTLPTFSLPKSASKPTPQSSPTPKNLTITITAPLPDAVEPKEAVVVSGVTQPGTTVFIQGPIDEDVVHSGPDGAYAGKITAIEGKNDITVTAYATGGNQAQQSVTIYYTQENF